MMILILDSRTAVEGAKAGLELCLKTVIPSLFPFFMLSVMLTSSLLGQSIGWLRPLGKLCGLPAGAESILLAGLLGGYPVGAQAVADARRSGGLKKQDAQRMLSFCSNAGPSFLFGMAASVFPERWMPWALWGIHVLSAILTAQVFPPRNAGQACPAPGNHVTINAAMNRALRIMTAVCGWVILFRVASAFLIRWFLWILPGDVQTALIGILELSNGCMALADVTDLRLRFILCSGMLAFGGICVLMQTASVTEGLSLKYYFRGKLVQTIFSLLLAEAVIGKMGFAFLLILVIFLLSLRKFQNRSSIRAIAGV